MFYNLKSYQLKLTYSANDVVHRSEVVKFRRGSKESSGGAAAAAAAACFTTEHSGVLRQSAFRQKAGTLTTSWWRSRQHARLCSLQNR